MDTKRITVFSLLCTLLFWSVSVCIARECVGQGECTCQFDDDNSIVDLSSIGNTDETPKFKDVDASDGSGKYSYNPCYPFNEGDCSGAAACMTDTVGNTEVIGTPQPVKYTLDGDDLYIGYDAGTGILTVTDVLLKCDQSACSPSLSAEGETSANNFQLTLTTVCACPNGCDSSGPINCKSGSSTIGGGTIFLIIFIALVFIYFVGGMAIMKFGRKASGSNIIPNVGFWKSLPSLIKDGCFLIIKRKGGSYQQK